jgi:hypothetical protein
MYGTWVTFWPASSLRRSSVSPDMSDTSGAMAADSAKKITKPKRTKSSQQTMPINSRACERRAVKTNLTGGC